MGARLVKFEFTPKENEQIDALIKVPEEPRSVIHGVVVDCNNKPIKDAVVKLLEVLPGNPCRMKPLTHTFSDECGQFLFGPLHPNIRYAIKVWYSDVKIREIIIAPDCDDPHCDGDHHIQGNSPEAYEQGWDVSYPNCQITTVSDFEDIEK